MSEKILKKTNFLDDYDSFELKHFGVLLGFLDKNFIALSKEAEMEFKKMLERIHSFSYRFRNIAIAELMSDEPENASV